MRPDLAGYSGTPLAKKLGVAAGTTLLAHCPPANYEALLAPLPEGVVRTSSASTRVDLFHLFATTKAELASLLRKTRGKMRPDAVVWVSWPKKASKVPTDITEDAIRRLAFPLDLVDIKVCAVDEVWSGLKLVIRKARRARRS